MEVRPCSECRRLFNYLSGAIICPGCRKKLEEKFQEVKDYINENEYVTMRQVSKDCEVRMTQIEKWIREGRLHVADEKDAYVYCESCGKVIPSGRYCNLCKARLLNDLGRALGPSTVQNSGIRKKESPKMRFVSR